MKADVVLDTRGLFCPLPIVKTAQAMRRLSAGGILEVISDDPAIEFDLPAWCRSSGHRIVEMIKDGDVFRYFLEKSR